MTEIIYTIPSRISPRNRALILAARDFLKVVGAIAKMLSGALITLAGALEAYIAE